MNPTLVIAGQAHLQSYLPAAATPAEVPTEVPLGEAIVLDGPLPRDDAYWARFVELARGGTAAIVWGGEQHWQFVTESAPPLDFVLSTAPDLPLDPRASYVAESQLRAALAPALTGLADLIVRLRQEGAQVTVAGTAPPIDALEALAGRVEATPPRPVEGPGGFTSPYTVQKIWSLVQTMTAEVTHLAGATFVPVPDRLRSPDGFLAQQVYGPGLWPDTSFGREMAMDLAGAALEADSNG